MSNFMGGFLGVEETILLASLVPPLDAIGHRHYRGCFVPVTEKWRVSPGRVKEKAIKGHHMSHP
jgi:hypothetical protein